MRARRLIRFDIPHLGTLLLTLVVLLLLGMPTRAWAHKVNVFAYVEGDQVVVEAYFPDGRKCRDSTVEVFDSQGNRVLTGKTDAEGHFAFRPPVRTDLLIRLIASMGHQAEYTVSAAELSGVEPLPSKPEAPPSAPGAEAESSTGSDSAKAAESSQSGPGAVDLSALEQAIDRAVARQILPLRRTIEEERDRRRFLDIVGGIGYIVGVMGLVAYLHSKRQKTG